MQVAAVDQQPSGGNHRDGDSTADRRGTERRGGARGGADAGTWHRHLRVVSKPLPPWFAQPHCLDALIYLDDLNDATGPIAVMPGSHRWLDRDAPSGYEPLPGERVFRLRAGDAILMHGNLWQRALPTVSARRRMLILSYTPSWLRHSPHHGPRPEAGLTTAFLEDADLEGRMLLGEGGYS